MTLDRKMPKTRLGCSIKDQERGELARGRLILWHCRGATAHIILITAILSDLAGRDAGNTGAGEHGGRDLAQRFAG